MVVKPHSKQNRNVHSFNDCHLAGPDPTLFDVFKFLSGLRGVDLIKLLFLLTLCIGTGRPDHFLLDPQQTPQSATQRLIRLYALYH